MNLDPKEGLTLEGVRVDLHGAAYRSKWLEWLRPSVVADVTYSVTNRESDRRLEDRRRVRLQSGKAADRNGNFLVDLIFVNRGCAGARIVLARCVPLPKKLWIYDDSARAGVEADVVWQNGKMAGCKFSSRQAPSGLRLLRRFERKYYAMR